MVGAAELPPLEEEAGFPEEGAAEEEEDEWW